MSPDTLEKLDPRRRRRRADNFGLRQLAELNPDLIKIEFEGAPYPDSCRFTLEANVRFATINPNPKSQDGIKLVRGDRSFLVLPTEYPDCEPLFGSTTYPRFHPNLGTLTMGAACLGVVGGWSPVIPLWRLVVFYYGLLTGTTFNCSSPMPDPVAYRASQLYPRLLAEGRLPWDRPHFVLPEKEVPDVF